MIDVVCYYADFGRPYRPLMERMAGSARQHVPGGRTVILTSTPKPWMADVFDAVAEYKSQSYQSVTPQNLCQQRAEATMSWAVYAERDTLFVDPDVEFRAAPRWPDADVGLLWRRDRPTMPVNTGVIMARAGRPDFWQAYGRAVVNLPARIHGWWCDQIGFSLLTGTLHDPGEILAIKDATVALLDAPANCSTPKDAAPDAWAVHYKGKLKGAGFGAVFDDILADDEQGKQLNHLREVA